MHIPKKKKATEKGIALKYFTRHLITHWEKYSILIGWKIVNSTANSVVLGKLQISMAKSVIHFECKYEKQLTINN